MAYIRSVRTARLTANMQGLGPPFKHGLFDRFLQLQLCPSSDGVVSSTQQQVDHEIVLYTQRKRFNRKAAFAFTVCLATLAALANSFDSEPPRNWEIIGCPFLQ
jgi:hypothetical protein